jgi:two-component system NtrC family response regulator
VPDAHGPQIVGESEATRQLGEELSLLLPSTARKDAPAILVTGESGTGKELVARYLRHHSPTRSRGPFQALNCAGLRGDLAESRLFGYVRGAFTGAVADAPGLFRAAHGGVLLLDEIGELRRRTGALLRALGPHRPRSVAEASRGRQVVLATNRRLEEEVAARKFRRTCITA